MRGAGGTAHGQLCDVLDSGQVEATVAAVDQEFGGVDILVDAVGGSTIIANSGAGIEELKLAEWQRLIDLNLRDNQRGGPRTTIGENAVSPRSKQPHETAIFMAACEGIVDWLDQRCASFETAAARLPQDEEFS